MSYELFEAFKNDARIDADDIISLKKGFNKKTGSQYVKATTVSGMTYVKEFTNDGAELKQENAVPFYETKEERNKIISGLYKSGCTQDEISDMVGVSQATVHNVLKSLKILKGANDGK